MRKAVAIMFHSVGLENYNWCYSFISEPIQQFDRKTAALRRHGYITSFFKDHVPCEKHDRKEVVLTFDDGYLDNWVHVFPILHKHDLKGTIFINPEFVDPRDAVRPQVGPTELD